MKVLAIGDGALGFWAAVRDVWPETKDQLCWVHKIANVLDKLPKGIQPRAKQALHAMMYAETKAACRTEIEKFAEDYGAKYPKAVASLVDNCDRQSAQRTWRCLDAHELIPLVRAGTRFIDGKQQERVKKTGASRQHDQPKKVAA